MTGQKSDALGHASLWLSDIEPKVRKTAKIIHNFGIRLACNGAMFDVHVLPTFVFSVQDIVQISLSNSTQFFFPVLGAWLIGSAVSMSDPHLREETLTLQFQDVQPKLIFCQNTNLETVKRSLENVGLLRKSSIIVMDLVDVVEDAACKIFGFQQLLQEADDFVAIPKSNFHENSNKVCHIMWSSGTTGRPKGITHGQHMLQSINGILYKKLTETVQSTCFYHGGGFVVGMNTMFNDCKAYFFPTEALEGSDAAIKVRISL